LIASQSNMQKRRRVDSRELELARV